MWFEIGRLAWITGDRRDGAEGDRDILSVRKIRPALLALPCEDLFARSREAFRDWVVLNWQPARTWLPQFYSHLGSASNLNESGSNSSPFRRSTTGKGIGGHLSKVRLCSLSATLRILNRLFLVSSKLLAHSSC